METETRMYVGETASPAFDGFSGFRIGQVYQLRFVRAGGHVTIQLDHGAPGAGPLVVTEAEFTRWFISK